ncbi:MAG: polysaccharide biosynthesis/export family protein [Dysgonamonadaceae bacterium]|jgi:polysaccharide export outer membrane protein|nr:polysaccharide biosynthesis/export family protein [Dysgonamonadaceae bacterium]
MLKLKNLLKFAVLILLFSCKSVPDDIIMFHDLNKGKVLSGSEINRTNYNITIRPESSLNIIVSSASTMDYQLKEQFNLLPLTSLDPQTMRVSNEMTFQRYRVDENGEINYPVLGKFKVQGLTCFEVESILIDSLKQKLSDPVVKVYIVMDSIKVFGEVNQPGALTVVDKYHYSILDAIADAGDINEFGDRKRVKLLREEEGKISSAILDLTSTDVFISPYFYLKEKDIIVVDPNRARKKNSQYGVADNYKLSVISTIIGTISTLTSLIIVAINSGK